MTCRNCAAPVSGARCAYCGTVDPDRVLATIYSLPDVLFGDAASSEIHLDGEFVPVMNPAFIANPMTTWNADVAGRNRDRTLFYDVYQRETTNDLP